MNLKGKALIILYLGPNTTRGTSGYIFFAAIERMQYNIS